MSAVVSQAVLMAKSAEGRLVSPVSLSVADQFLGAAPAALEGFEVGDVGVGLVGDEHLEAVAVDVGEGELGAGVGFFAADDRPGARRASGTGRPGR